MTTVADRTNSILVVLLLGILASCTIYVAAQSRLKTQQKALQKPQKLSKRSKKEKWRKQKGVRRPAGAPQDGGTVTEGATPVNGGSTRCTLFLSNLPRRSSKGFVKGHLCKAFAPFNFSFVKVPQEGRFWNKGFGHVIFRRRDDAERALAALDGKIEIDGSLVRISHVTGKTDQIFSFMPYHIRKELKIDGVGETSVTESAAAEEIASLLTAVVEAGGCRASDAVATDGTACCGGCTIALGRVFGRTQAVELDVTRQSYLTHNIELLGLADRVTTIHGDISLLCAGLEQDVILLDPPWGGSGYSRKSVIEDLSMGSMSLVELCVSLRNHRRSMVLALRLPFNFDIGGLTAKLLDTATLPEEWPVAEHDPHPFCYKFKFGDKGAMLLMCMPTLSPRAEGPTFCISNVDRVIAAIDSWDRTHGGQHKPDFLDWDKKRWIRVNKWLGVDAGRGRIDLEQG